MKEDQILEEHLRPLKGLGGWKQYHDLSDTVFQAIQENEKSKTIRLMTVSGLLAILFSGILLTAGMEIRQTVTKTRLEQVAETYEVNNLNF